MAEQGGMPSLAIWNHRLQILNRNRGRVWRNVTKVGNVDAATARVQVNLPDTGAGGLEAGAIVYAFELGPPNSASSAEVANTWVHFAL